MYDPFLNHLFIDAREKKKQADQAAKDQQGQIDAQKAANSPGRQLTNLGAVAGITAGIPAALSHAWPVETTADKLLAAQLAKTGGALAPNVGNATQGALFTGGIPDASIGAPGSLGSAVSATSPDAAMLLGDSAAAAPAEEGVIGSVLPASANISGLGFGPLAAIAGATYLGGQAGYDMLKGKKPGLPGRVILGMATGGLSEVANHFLGQHKTTRQTQQENTQNLLSQSDDPAWQGYVSAMRGQNETGPSDASMPYGDSKGNKYANFQDYKNSATGLDAANLTGVVGNLQLYGPAWAKLTEAQRQAVVQKNIESNIYDSKKGEVVITDPTIGKQNFDSVVGQQPVLGMAQAPGIVPVANVSAAAQGAAPPKIVNPPRSMTISPGLNLKGQRIAY